MQNILALIYSSEFDEKNYDTLCKYRPDYMLPFGCRYRIIDFTLSNITNHNISSVILYGGEPLRSTLDHVGDGRNWELNRRSGGLMINPPVYNRSRLANEIETYYNTMKHFMKNKREYVYITNPMYITKVNISDAYERMQEEDIDALIFTQKKKDEYGYYLNRRIINTDEKENPLSVGINLGLEEEINLFTGSILIKKDIFMDLIRYSIEKNNSTNILDALFKYPKKKSIGLYKSKERLSVIMDTLTYFEASFNLMDREYFDEIFYKQGMVYTKSKDEPSTEYLKGSKVRNSLVANGALIEGEIENSIIFRGVKVKKGAVIKNSIIFQNSEIGEGAILNHVITDKDTKVLEDVKLFGNRNHPYLTDKGEHVN
ncbi:MAG: glucose-1-phosphate adenylyltransferase subunit GlgD [Anaerococcus vaginalis]|nr:glucose-1-phosphate adenylyltransferase subunit GlgD [Anaerococcus vaginalis]MDU7163434.1 glucose-1-phosphate adenylyltransferase subunit GlgD [Anaerococcus vaginalis]